MEKFAGLNIHSFNPTEVSAEILSHFLSQKCLLLKSGTCIDGKTSLVNCENHGSLAQQIFSRLWYSLAIFDSEDCDSLLLTPR